MSTFKPTLEQKAIFDYIKNEKGNLVVMARAGCGKTSTIVEALNHISWSAKATFLCFNRHIKDELQKRVPKNVLVYTTHSIGQGALMRKYKNAKFDEHKMLKIINKLGKKWTTDLLNEDHYDYYRKLLKIAKLAKQTISVDKTALQFLVRKYEISIDKEHKDLDRVLKILEKSVEDTNTYDYDDMIFLPATDPKIWMFPNDFIFIDEMQDLNRAQQLMINKMIKRDKLKNVTGRFIAIGDGFQAIQGFAGSDNKSFEWFTSRPNTKILPLTYTFRCGKNIVNLAQEIVPDIKPLPNAIDGVVRSGNFLDECRESDFVLCRKSKPLLVAFFQLLVKGKKAYVKGSEIGERLIEKAGDFKTKEEMNIGLAQQLDQYRANLLEQGIFNYKDNFGYNEYKDTVDSLLLLSKTVKTIDELKQMISKIFKDDEGEGVILSTIHKSKGLEADRVFILLPNETLPQKMKTLNEQTKEELIEWKYPLNQPQQWMKEQEMNLRYVAITRAKRELIFDYNWTDVKTT
jgi:superfamily I DNA/RNA helicase